MSSSATARNFLQPPPSQNCLICSESVEVVENSKNNGKVCQTFCRIAGRYLSFKCGNFGPPEHGDNCSSILCENCLPLAESFCKIYIEFQYLEQLFHSRMKESIDKIRIQMEQSLDDHDHDDVDETGIESRELNRIDFREKFVLRGQQKLFESAPTLQLDTQALGLNVEKSQTKIIINLQESQSSKISEPEKLPRDPLEIESDDEIVELRDDEEVTPSDISYWCEVCNKDFTQIWEFQQHRKSCVSEPGGRNSGAAGKSQDADAGTHSCKFCGKSFAFFSTLRTHQQRLHTGAKPYKCRFCPRAFPSAGNRDKHELVHTGARPYECTICGQKYRHSNTLNIHGKSKHPGQKFRGERKKKSQPKSPFFKCAMCCKVFGSLKHKLIHEQSHSISKVDPVTVVAGKQTIGKDKTCQICGNSYDRWSGLRDHLRTHTGAKPFKCKTCGRGFASKGNLNVHEKTHYDDRPYECAICGIKFRQTGTLNTHGRLNHPGEKFRMESTESFKCSFCDKVFEKLAHKVNHERSHWKNTEELPFQCGICYKRYRLQGQLEVHEIEIHGKCNNNDQEATGIETPDPDAAVEPAEAEGDVDEEGDIQVVKVENPPSPEYEIITLI